MRIAGSGTHILEIEWLTEPSSTKRVPLSREDFDAFGRA
jgi:hypothetical protein